jgi:aminomethyltransferase
MHRGGGRVAKKLVGLTFAPDDVVKPGDVIRVDEREVGRITSVTRSPALEKPIALGYVHRDYTAPGTGVQVLSSSGPLTAQVSSLPFVPLALRLH